VRGDGAAELANAERFKCMKQALALALSLRERG